MIYLHTLGDSLITVGEKDVRPTSPLVFAVLLYLGMERGRRVSRAALQELLFPNVDERSGAHSLRQLLYKLRQLGAPLDADASSVSFKADDVQDDSTEELNLTNGSLAKAGFGFLPGYAPKLSDTFDEWLESQRAAVAANVRRQLVSAMMRSRETLSWAAVERYARVVLQIDPCNHDATMVLAEAIAMFGAKSEAMQLLTKYEQETGHGPLKLAPSLLKRRISESIPETSRRTVRTPFVGRETDAEAVRHHILRARRGEPSMLVLTGEAGIGKTRLLEEVAGLAALEGMLVLTVRCQSHYASRPLGVFIELVPTLLAARGALGVAPQSLALLNLLTSHDDARGDRPTDARDDVSRSSVLLAALRDLVDAVSAETPMVIVIEDAHWADVDSLRELHGLIHAAAKRPLSIVYTARTLESLQKVATLDDETVVHRLKPLDENSMAMLAQRLLPPNVADDGALGSWCVETAAGNPFFLQMLCAHYAATGQPFTVPPDLVSATTRRIERLPQDCRRILEFSALLGRHSTIESLRSLSETTHLQLLNSVQRLEEGGYLQMRGDAARVSHDLLSECTLSLVTPVARRVLHSCVATNLEQRYDSTHDASLLWDCAEHWVQSGETGKALELLKRCARHAAQLGKASQALTLLQRAKQLAKYPAELAEVLAEMMLAGKAAGHWGEVHDLARERARLNTDPAEGTDHSQLELISIEAHWAMNQSGGAEQLSRCVAAPDAPLKHRLDAALLLMRLAQELCDSDKATVAYGYIENLIDESSTQYSARLLPIVYHTTFGDRYRALAAARKLRGELRFMEPVADQFRAAFNISLALALLGHPNEAVDVAKEYYEQAGALGMVNRQRELCSHLCSMHLLLEDYETAAFWYDRIDGNGQPDRLSAKRDTGEAFELALWKRDIAQARRALTNLSEASAGESLRGKAYLRASETRFSQLDPGYVSDDRTVRELLNLHDATKRFLSGDTLAVALGESFKRRGELDALRSLLEDYQEVRRELTPLPPSLASLKDAAEVRR